MYADYRAWVHLLQLRGWSGWVSACLSWGILGKRILILELLELQKDISSPGLRARQIGELPLEASEPAATLVPLHDSSHACQAIR